MCLPGDLGCEAAGAVLGGVAESAFNAIIKSTLESVTDMLAAISTMWFEVPDPQVGDSASLGTPSDSVGWLQTNLAGLVLLVGMLSLMLAIGRMLWNNSGRELLGVARMILAMLASTGFAVGVVTVLLEAGDAFARWIVQEAAGAQASAEAIVALWPLVADPGKTLWLVLGLLALLGAIMQVAFMVVRGAAVIVLMGLLPLVAANSATPEGNQQLRRVVGLLAGFVLYKPVAAIIYAVGIRLMHGVDGDLMSAVYGMVIIILAAVALPAMIKFFMPAAAAGSSNLFSGGTAATVAAGAAMVAVGGGAALAGGGGSAGVATAGGGGAGSSGLGRGAATAPPQGGGGASLPARRAAPSDDLSADVPAGGDAHGMSSEGQSSTGGSPSAAPSGAAHVQGQSTTGSSPSAAPSGAAHVQGQSSPGGSPSAAPSGAAHVQGQSSASGAMFRSPRGVLGDVGSSMVARGSGGTDPVEPEGSQ